MRLGEGAVQLAQRADVHSARRRRATVLRHTSTSATSVRPPSYRSPWPVVASSGVTRRCQQRGGAATVASHISGTRCCTRGQGSSGTSAQSVDARTVRRPEQHKHPDAALAHPADQPAVSSASAVARSSSQNSSSGQRPSLAALAAAGNTPRHPIASVDMQTRSTPRPGAAISRSAMLVFSASGTPTPRDQLRMSRPDIGLAMMPIATQAPPQHAVPGCRGQDAAPAPAQRAVGVPLSRILSSLAARPP